MAMPISRLNWNKMVDALHRAVAKPGVDKNDVTIAIKEKIRDAANDDLDFDKAFTKAKVETDEMNSLSRTPDKFDSEKRDILEDELTDKRLEKELDEALDDIAEERGYEKWKSYAKDKPLDDGMDGDIHNLEREGAVDDVRQDMIDDLKSGMSISDVLEKYSK